MGHFIVPRIIIDAVSQSEMRYDTLGDWFVDSVGDTRIRVVGRSPLDAGCFLVALHELVEMFLCQEAGISQEEVDRFDMNFLGDGEPGEERTAPYMEQHDFARIVEHMVAHKLGIFDYETSA